MKSSAPKPPPTEMYERFLNDELEHMQHNLISCLWFHLHLGHCVCGLACLKILYDVQIMPVAIVFCCYG